MANPTNFLEYKYSLFSDGAVDAADNGRLKAARLIRDLDRINDIAKGLEQVFKIARANVVQRDCFTDRVDDEAVEPPLSNYAIDCLLGLGQAISAMVVQDIEFTASWANKHGAEDRP